MPNLNQQLLPCPFCGATEIHESSNGHESHMLVCESCGAEGPADISDSKAADAWNRRQHGSAAQAVAYPILQDAPVGQRAAILSAIRFVDERVKPSRCDCEAVSECRRCNAVYLASVLRKLVFAAPPVADTEHIKTWQERVPEGAYAHEIEAAKDAEIAELCAALSRLNGGTK